MDFSFLFFVFPQIQGLIFRSNLLCGLQSSTARPNLARMPKNKKLIWVVGIDNNACDIPVLENDLPCSRPTSAWHCFLPDASSVDRSPLANCGVLIAEPINRLPALRGPGFNCGAGEQYLLASDFHRSDARRETGG